MALQGLIETTMTGIDHCPLEEYVNGENEVPVCLDASSESREEEFFVSLGREDKDDDDDDDDEDQESEELSQEPPPQSKLKTYKEAISSLEDVQLFLENQGHVDESMQLGTLVDKRTIARISTMKQKLFVSSFSQTIIIS